MPDLLPQERLQPSLLDRLLDDAPDVQQEPREHRLLSLTKLRQSVVRDLGWLLNARPLGPVVDLSRCPAVARSVVNYGVPDLTGTAASGVDVQALEQSLRQAILAFEPRILAGTLRVTVTLRDTEMSHNSLSFDIEGQLWAQPVPLHLLLRTQIDLETGEASIADGGTAAGAASTAFGAAATSGTAEAAEAVRSARRTRGANGAS